LPGDEHFHPIGELASLRAGRMLACAVEGRSLVICRTADGLHALDDVCTHADARMSEGRLRGSRLVCPLHGAAFDVTTGRVLAGPAPRPLAVHQVRVVDGMIEVALDPAAPTQPDPF
jgi:nitrite reductase/ring-hydroxylating ferredoxin subunit